MTGSARAYSVLAASTLGFGVCFAVWMMNGVLVTFLVDNHVFAFDQAQMGWLIGLPVLTGSILRLPAGLLADRYGGRPVFMAVMLVSAAAAWLTSWGNGFWDFALGGLAFGLAGASFAVGVAYVSLWFPREKQGTALGLFGMGTVGAAATSFFAPRVLDRLTAAGSDLAAWRLLPRYYAGLLVLATIVFWLLTTNRRPEEGAAKSLGSRLAPLRFERVWRFGFYYLLVFGGFVALAQWLIPYYVNVYGLEVAAAGALAAAFSFPSAVFRPLGGWLSDRYGPRRVMHAVLAGSAVCSLLLAVPRMDVYSPGEGIMASAAGTVREVTAERVVVDATEYRLRARGDRPPSDREMLVWPRIATWHETSVAAGDRVARRQLLASGVTHVYFQANRSIFTGIVLALGLCMGVGMGAVYKYIPTHFPKDVGVVGGIVGVLGGLGGFLFPILFGTLLRTMGLWTTCWLLFLALSLACLVWMHRVVQRLMAEGQRRAEDLEQQGAPPQPSRPLARSLLLLAGTAALALAGCEPTNQGYAPRQPVNYSHAVHAGGLRIPCLYCHFGAERGRHAGIPPASVCLNCHRQVIPDHPEVRKVKAAVESGKPIDWVRVHQLPDHAYFDHRAHASAGVSCQSCHGAVEEMGRVSQTAPLTMGFCLDCHRRGSERTGGGFGAIRAGRANRLTDCAVCHH